MKKNLAVLSFLGLSFSVNVYADVVCVKRSVRVSGVNTVALPSVIRKYSTRSTCPSGYSKLLDTSVFRGPPGSDGTDASPKVYGDGSAGDFVATNDTFHEVNNQFHNFSVPEGVNLSVESGTVIRATGTVTIFGTISVNSGGTGGKLERFGAGSTLTHMASRAAQTGLARQAAENAEAGPNTVDLYGGIQGLAINTNQALALRYPSILGGGGGSGALNGIGGSAGGVLTILSSGTLTIGATGVIDANGGFATFGAGGGSGGIVILGSKTNITNSGAINARGGGGADSSVRTGSGGGGGGGIVHLLSPANVLGATDVAGASAGGTSTPVSDSIRSGGGAGGACGGNGGFGGSAYSSNSTPAGTAGQEGVAVATTVDPTGLF